MLRKDFLGVGLLIEDLFCLSNFILSKESLLNPCFFGCYYFNSTVTKIKNSRNIDMMVHKFSFKKSFCYQIFGILLQKKIPNAYKSGTLKYNKKFITNP